MLLKHTLTVLTSFYVLIIKLQRFQAMNVEQQNAQQCVAAVQQAQSQQGAVQQIITNEQYMAHHHQQQQIAASQQIPAPQAQGVEQADMKSDQAQNDVVAFV